MKELRYKFIKYTGVGLIVLTSMKCMREYTLVPLIVPLIGAVYAIIWLGIAEIYKPGGKKNE